VPRSVSLFSTTLTAATSASANGAGALARSVHASKLVTFSNSKRPSARVFVRSSSFGPGTPASRVTSTPSTARSALPNSRTMPTTVPWPVRCHRAWPSGFAAFFGAAAAFTPTVPVTTASSRVFSSTRSEVLVANQIAVPMTAIATTTSPTARLRWPMTFPPGDLSADDPARSRSDGGTPETVAAPPRRRQHPGRPSSNCVRDRTTETGTHAVRSPRMRA